MEIKVEKFRKKLVEIKKKNNLSNREVSEIMELDFSYLFRVFNGQCEPGKKFIEGITKFCKIYNLNPNDYIFLK